MKIKLITIAKDNENAFDLLFQDYAKRVSFYSSFETVNLKPGKSANAAEQLKSEAALLLKKAAQDPMILLDEKGKEMTSNQFASFIEGKTNTATRSLLFVIGGAYGFDKSIYDHCDGLISLSKMTLPHQLAKVVFAEQLYRAFTIMRNEKYHHGNH